jgi:hypothetical protein
MKYTNYLLILLVGMILGYFLHFTIIDQRFKRLDFLVSQIERDATLMDNNHKKEALITVGKVSRMTAQYMLNGEKE